MKDKFNLYNEGRLSFSMLFILSIFSLFVIRLFDWQILKNDIFVKRASEANTFFLKTDPIRGEIYDRYGVGLAVNNSHYRIIIERLDVPKDKENELIAKLVKFVVNLGNSFISSLPIILNSEKKFVFLPDKNFQIKHLKKILKMPENSSAGQCMDELSKKFKCEYFNLDDKYNICSVKYNNFRLGITSKASPLLLFDSVNEKTMAIISEYSERLKGVKIDTSLKRTYVNPELASHVIGYIGLISNEEYEKYKDKGKYNLDSLIGKSGIESVLEEELRGDSGKRSIQLSRNNSVINSNQIFNAKPGNSVFLTLSSKLQEAANESLKRNIIAAKKNGARDCNSGAVVVIDLKNFEILAVSSYPTFNLERYAKEPEYASQIINDKQSPLLDRAFCGCYAPGSTFKPIIALAALEENLIDLDEKIKCNGQYNHYKGYTLHCMGVHGNVFLKKALAKSCNVFFAELGRRLGATKISQYAKKIGFGVKTGVEILEKEGILNDPERSKRLNLPWYVSTPSQIAIGQSDTSITALQLAVAIGSIAIGKRFKPHIIKKITDYSKKNIIKEYKEEVIEEKIASDENLQKVKEGMREVVLSGTATDFRNFEITVAGKTGTAQNKGTDHTLFTCYAPFENPEIAIAVILSNGKFGINSKNVAKDILRAYLVQKPR